MHAVLSKIAKGITVCYSEVFPEHDNDFFHLDYMGKLFIIADSYCMNPDCTCQEAVLNFVQVYPREGKKADSFMISLKLNGRGYKIYDQGKFHRGEIKNILLRFNVDNKIGNLLKERFKEMRGKAKEILC
ncbi:hypothetical protein [Bacillus sp. B15-48]|uniref:hypothetical protein n=1 Tax=Bacillus sp. B15-48 TaxID=1548601 RepID=UPI00193EEE41|nr:hypothetical protein [Bacillus sp. B15-48]MBM4763115.1 hypothetical protein [Bacillus sp. B15-48]